MAKDEEVNIPVSYYSPCKISCTVAHRIHAAIQCFKNAPTYFAATVNFTCKNIYEIVTRSEADGGLNTPGANVMKLVSSLMNKLERLSITSNSRLGLML